MGCIYGFFDRKGKTFYVGQTKWFESRIGNHKHELDKGNKLYSYNKLRKEMRETGKSIKEFVLVIEDNIPDGQLDDREIYHIQNFRNLGYKLTNLTDGGRGAMGFTPAKQKQMAKKRIGKKRSEETKRKMSLVRMGMKFSKEHIQHLCEARQKRVISQETKIKTRETSTGKINIKVLCLMDPNGAIHKTARGLNQFCKEHSLPRSLVTELVSGKREELRGWKIWKGPANEHSITGTN